MTTLQILRAREFPKVQRETYFARGSFCIPQGHLYSKAVLWGPYSFEGRFASQIYWYQFLSAESGDMSVSDRHLLKQLLILQRKRNKFILYHHFPLKEKKEKQNTLSSIFQFRIFFTLSFHCFPVTPQNLTTILPVMAFVELHQKYYIITLKVP